MRPTKLCAANCDVRVTLPVTLFGSGVTVRVTLENYAETRKERAGGGVGRRRT
jgi:hypothetical protein